jgi:hypothetical protein
VVYKSEERQGYDLQLRPYDEKGWRAKFYTNGDRVLAYQRDGPRVGTHTVARDAAGGVGGAQARERLTDYTAQSALARLTRGARFWRRTEWALYRIVRDGSQV